LGERLTTSHRKKNISVSKPGIKPRIEGLDKGGQGPISGCCAIEEEEEEEKSSQSAMSSPFVAW
jgi:hypothetical protein